MRTLINIIDSSKRLRKLHPGSWEPFFRGTLPAIYPSDIDHKLLNSPGFGHVSLYYLTLALADEVERLEAKLAAVREVAA